MSAGQVLISRDEIRARTLALAQEVTLALPPGPVHAVVILKSAIFFGVDLIRALGREASLGFLFASSYGDSAESAGAVALSADALGRVTGQNVLLIDDILDTGNTLAAAAETLRALRPASLRTCVLLDKPSRRQVPFEADHVGFPIEDVFVVGYGMDFGGRFRTLPDIRVYRQEKK